MLLAVFSGILLALLLMPFGSWLKGKLSFLFGLLPLSLFAYFLSYIPKVAKEKILFNYEWIPSLGINFSFNLDGLSLLFSLLITGIGSLVFFYTSNYLKGHPYLDRFYSYLGIFMSAMLGLVLSDNLILMFVFWELTSISSFFLIGFNNEDEGSRKSSLIALAITGGGGLLLMVGLILIASISNSYSFQEILNSGHVMQNHALYGLILLFIFSGAFTKSAQFPFHFWLPGAMKAPTPVSTYLHSATMVKAGIYLLARFTPLLGNHLYWNTTLIIIGSLTMLYAAFHTLFRTDLKSILAYSTISALGILVFLLGIGTDRALEAAMVFILVHALYKAALFLITGIIDHKTGTRDVSKLSGLGMFMLPVATAGMLAAFSNAGFPPLFGFIGKDLIYEATLNAPSYGITLTILAILTNVLLLYAGFQVGVKPFLGKRNTTFKNLKFPSPWLWIPPFLLATLSLLIGIFPQFIDSSIVKPAATAMSFTQSLSAIKLWHGFNFILLLSSITLLLGLLLYKFWKASKKKNDFIKKFEQAAPLNIFKGAMSFFVKSAGAYTKILQNGYLRIYVLTIIVFLISLLAYKLFTSVNLYIDYSSLSDVTFYEVMILVIMFFAIIMSVFSNSRLAAIASMGVVGFSICLLFVFYSAPDLAMTQFAIDTLTVVMFVLIIYKLPKYLVYSNLWIRVRDGFVALLFGGLIIILIIEVMNESMNKATANFYAENAYILAKGKNVVNVILVDFRGLDTLVEITVLSIAAIGVYSLLKLNVKLEK